MRKASPSDFRPRLRRHGCVARKQDVTTVTESLQDRFFYFYTAGEPTYLQLSMRSIGTGHMKIVACIWGESYDVVGGELSCELVERLADE